MERDMERNLEKEMDVLQAEMADIKGLLQAVLAKQGSQGSQDGACGQKSGVVEIMRNMHPEEGLSSKMEELCTKAGAQRVTGMVTYMGVFSSGGRQSNWIRNMVDTDRLLKLVEDHTAEKVLRCLGNNDRLNILLAILKRPMSVAELVEECGLNSTGQAYHHMKTLLAADLIVEEHNKGIYAAQCHKVQGIIMLLAGISDMVDETYTVGSWEETES